MVKSLFPSSMLAFLLLLTSGSTAFAAKPLCEFVVSGDAREGAYVQEMTGAKFQVKSAAVELQMGLSQLATQAFFPSHLPKQNLSMSAGSDLTNESTPAVIEIFSSGLLVSKIEFKRMTVLAWSKDEEEAEDPTFPQGHAVGYAQDHEANVRRFVSIKDKKKSLNFTIGIDVPCDLVGRYTSDYASIRQVNTNTGSASLTRCRIPVLKAKIKKPEVIFSSSPNWPVTG